MSIPRLAFTPLPRPSHSLLQRLRHPAPTSLAPHRSFTSASPIRFRGSTITGAGATARASSLSPEQESALSEWTKYVASVRTTQEDVADLNRARQLALCLPSPIRGGKAAGRDPVEKGGTDIWGIKEGDTMSYGASLALFNPLLPESDLSSDGTEHTFGPPPPLLQRMWAGGSFTFSRDNPLKVGDKVRCDVGIEKVDRKSGIKTGDMVLVWRTLVTSNEQGPSVTERRCHVYRRPDPTKQKASSSSSSPAAPAPSLPSADFSMSYLPTRPTLFRYSALTFNAHRIHLDPEYCREEEGHPDCLVHGPLTATLLMDLLVKRGIPSTLSGNNSEAGGVPGIKHFEYRATAPLVVCRTISLNGRWEGERTGDGERKATLWATDENGRVGMKAEAVVFGL